MKINQWKPVLLNDSSCCKRIRIDTVILVGLEEGILPSTRSLNSEEQIEEERRLFYVGITRAQERLLISNCKFRYTFGTMTDQRPSRFIQEIPARLAPSQDSSYWQHGQFVHYFGQWLYPTKNVESSVRPYTHDSKITHKKIAEAPICT